MHCIGNGLEDTAQVRSDGANCCEDYKGDQCSEKAILDSARSIFHSELSPKTGTLRSSMKPAHFRAPFAKRCNATVT